MKVKLVGTIPYQSKQRTVRVESISIFGRNQSYINLRHGIVGINSIVILGMKLLELIPYQSVTWG